MWIVLSLIAALATSLTTIFAKIGIKDVNSDFATAYRTGIVIIFSVILCLISGSIFEFGDLSLGNWLFLSGSGIATGLSWLCYYKALKLSSVNKVAPIDKSSFILTSLLFIIFFFDATTNGGNILTIIMLVISILLIGSGTFLMIDLKKEDKKVDKKRIFYAILSAVFASVVSLLIKLGLSGIKSDLGTLVRTIIVFIFASLIVVFKKEYREISKISGKSWIFLTFSGIATGVAWLTEYAALNINEANPVAVNSIGKLSILLTMLFSGLILKEKFSIKSIIGLGLLTAGIILIIVFSL